MLFQLLYQIMMILSYPLCCGLMTLYENLASTIEYLNTKIPNNQTPVIVSPPVLSIGLKVHEYAAHRSTRPNKKRFNFGHSWITPYTDGNCLLNATLHTRRRKNGPTVMEDGKL